MKALVLFCCVAGLAQQTADPFERGLEAYSRGRFAEAERQFRAATAGRPGSFDAHFLLGATLVQLDRRSAAIEQLREAVRLNPAHGDARKLLASQYAIGRDYPAAISLLQKAPALDEEMHLLLIDAYQTSGDTSNSFALAQKAVARFPASPQVNCWMGFQLQFSGRYAEAKKYLKEALRLAPDYPATYYLLGDVLLKEQDYAAAVPYFRTAIEKDPEDLDARLGLAQALIGMADFPNAQAALHDAAKVAPQDSRVHLQLSRLYYRMGDGAEADREAELSLRLRKRETSPTEAPAALRSAGSDR